MSFRRLLTLRRSALNSEPSASPLLGSYRSLSISTALLNAPTSNSRSILLYGGSNANALCLTMVASSVMQSCDTRLYGTQTQAAPPQAISMGAVRLSVLSPAIIYEPYAPREKIPVWKRWFKKSGWKQTKEDIIIELKSAYVVAKLRKTGYSKQRFYVEAFDLYKETLKNEIKQRESRWGAVHWELIGPAVWQIGVDPKDLSKLFIQLTLEFLTKQKFEAYNSKGAVVAGDKNKEVLVRGIWVFEKSMFHKGSFWLLCGRIPVQPNQSNAPKSA